MAGGVQIPVESAPLGGSGRCLAVDTLGPEPVRVLARRRGAGVGFRRMAAADGVPARTPVAAALSPREGLTRVLTPPFRAPGKARRVLATLLDIDLPFDLDECIVCYLDQTARRSAPRWLAVVGRRQAVGERIEELRRRDLDPACLDHAGVAAWTQSLEEAPPEEGVSAATRVVMLLEAEQALVSLGRGPVFAGSYAVREREPARIARLVRAHRGDGNEPVEWVFAGSGAADARRCEAARSALLALAPGTVRVIREPETFLARALAQRALTAGPLRCDLRQGEFVHAAVARRRRRGARRAALACGAAALAVLAADAAVLVAARSRLRAADRRIQAAVDRLAGYEVAARGEDALTIVEGMVAERRAALRPFARMFEPSPADLLTRVVRVAARHRLHLTAVDLRDTRATVRGTAPDWDACEPLARALRANGFDVATTREERLEDERVGFRIDGEAAP